MSAERDLLNIDLEDEDKKHKMKRIVPTPNSYFLDVQCSRCSMISIVFSHSQTIFKCPKCQTVLARPSGGNKKTKKKKKKLERDREINDELDREKEEMEQEIKLLVLGTGDSGKTTFIKQIQILYKEGFTENDKKLYRNVIRNNLLSHAKILVNACRNLDIPLESSNEEIAEEIIEIPEVKNGKIEVEQYEMIQALWSDSALKHAYERRSEFQLPDTADYYLDDVERIMDDEFTPNTRDILNCRIPTSGVRLLNFNIDGIPWRVVDVGGQRSERRKWIHQFDNVTTLIYVVAVSEYNQKLYEKDGINRLDESLVLFTKTINNKFFKKKNCVILFNKYDLFSEKIKIQDLKVCFPKYKGGKNVEKASKYIKNVFYKAGKNRKRRLYHQFTVGTQTSDIEKVFEIVDKAVANEIKKLGGRL
ncbi:guanine nucleotide-binding protein subunit alpha [Anaeramoeba flamelloides]|uniref:40S ribosomal protein S27 n=1 Tax=Anaeramoeba flamelloides TaxID=1746091 RepID=A0AAV7YD07_9EUKA|nr:guanine nucleotide-binding protein subunit alpha [Anaeramoeba flamelloides]